LLFSKVIRAGSTALHSHQMASSLPLALTTKQYGFGMWLQERQLLLSKVIRTAPTALHSHRMASYLPLLLTTEQYDFGMWRRKCIKLFSEQVVKFKGYRSPKMGNLSNLSQT